MVVSKTAAMTTAVHHLHFLHLSFKELQQATSLLISNHRHRLALLQQRMDDASPQKLLARGYSITLKDGKPVKDASMLHQGDVLVSLFEKGKIESCVQKNN